MRDLAEAALSGPCYRLSAKLAEVCCWETRPGTGRISAVKILQQDRAGGIIYCMLKR